MSRTRKIENAPIQSAAARCHVIDDAQITAQILACLAQREPGSSSCPSEVARALAPMTSGLWRALMPRVRQVVAGLARRERVVVTRGARILSPDDLSGGPIRIRRGKRFDD